MEKSNLRRTIESKRIKADRKFIASILATAIIGGGILGRVYNKDSRMETIKDTKSNTTEPSLVENPFTNQDEYFDKFYSSITKFDQNAPLEPAIKEELNTLYFNSNDFLLSEPECKIIDFGETGVGVFTDAIKDNTELTLQCGEETNKVNLNYSEKVFPEVSYLNAPNYENGDKRPSISEIGEDLYKLKGDKNFFCGLQPYTVDSTERAIFTEKTNNSDLYVTPITVVRPSEKMSYPIKPVYIEGNSDLTTQGNSSFALFERQKSSQGHNDRLNFLGIHYDDELCGVDIISK